MLTSDTKRRIDSCRDILVGKLPLPTDQVELITLALIYKFMDDLDEESVAMGGKRSFFTGPLAAYRWRALTAQTVSADERMTLFADGLELLGGGKKLRVPKKHGKKGEEEEIDPAAHLPALFRDIFRNAFLKFRDGRILTLFLTELGGFAYSHSEELGNAFEYILQCMGAQGDNGQFRTPRHIIDFMVACLDPQPTDKILDPACGTGGFLVSAFKHILQKNTSPGSTLPGDRLGHEQRQRLYANFTGYDTNDQMVKLSRVNLFLHQFASPTIHIYDTLTNDARWAEKADLILANPPFMTPKGGVVPHTRFRIPAKKSEVLFTDYIAEHLTPDGRAGVIVPNGIVANVQKAYIRLRRFLVEDSLVAVVSLPAGVFKPYSGVKTSILLLDKKLARNTDKILFLKIVADGFDLGDQRREIEANDLPEATPLVKSWLKRELVEPLANPIKWKLVEKRSVLAHRTTSLRAEPYFGGPAVEQVVEVARLADVAEINPKKSEVRSLAPDTPVSFVPMERLSTDRPSFTGAHERPIGEVLAGYTYFRDGDVLLAKITPCFENGKAGIARNLRNGIGFGSSEFYVFRCSEKVVPEYLYYLITRPAFREEGEQNMSGTGGQQRVTREFIENYEIPLPQIDEQRQIVARIRHYENEIGRLEAEISTNRDCIQQTIDTAWSGGET
ncbi:MAG TPA: N-6 DNA methylase [Opitutaceae bacterium]|nr:N-6 DNA methylase [Opitutaceae bacterium]